MKTYSVAEVCAIIGCDSERWLITRVRSGVFPARKIVRDIRFTEEDVQDILNACAYSPGDPEVPDVFIPELSARSKRSA